MQKNKFRFLFAGGGTGGHLFPALAVAEKIKMILPEADILFVGTKSKIEGRVVPELGFKFRSIWIKGYSRKFTLENLLFPLRLLVSVIQSMFINITYRPKVAIGTGGYAAGPAVWAASLLGAKTILVEQNSYPGVTTKLLQSCADEIHLSFDESKKYFKDKNKLFITGNPVRENLVRIDKSVALKKFNLKSELKTLLILGGSLGAKSINNAVEKKLKVLVDSNIQVIWQTGKAYFESYRNLQSEKVCIKDFIKDMAEAYSACDLVIARAGATSIAEILYLGLPAIVVPSPNVAENHQYHNAKSLAELGAVVLLEDKDLDEKLTEVVLENLFDDSKLKLLSDKAKTLSKPQAAQIIAERAVYYAKRGAA